MTNRLLTMMAAAVAATIPVAASADGLSDRIGVALVASHYHASGGDVMRVLKTAGLSIWDGGRIYQIAEQTHRNPNDLARNWRSRDWDGPRDGPRPRRRYDSTHDFWVRMLHGRYSTSDREVTSLERDGASISDAVTAVVIAQNGKTDSRRVWDEYEHDRDWSHVARDFHVDPRQWDWAVVAGGRDRDRDHDRR